MEETKQTIYQADQTAVKIVIVRGGKAPKIEARVSSVCMKGDEKKLIDELVEAHKKIYRDIEAADMGTSE